MSPYKPNALTWLAVMMAASALAAPAEAQDAEPARMLANTTPPATSQAVMNHVIGVKTAFKGQYARAGRPRIALFWNRKLDDQLSQWYTSARNIDTHESAWQSRGFTAAQQRENVEGRFAYRDQPSELAGFEFGAGLTRTLINAGTQIIDRDAIMRLEHGKASELADGVVLTDYQEIEMDALLDYADLYAELMYAERSAAGDSFTVMVSIKNVRTGQTIAMFRSRPNALPAPATRTQWVPGAQGYERFEVPTEDAAVPALADGIEPGTPEYLGWMVALQTMEALSAFWSSGAG